MEGGTHPGKQFSQAKTLPPDSLVWPWKAADRSSASAFCPAIREPLQPRTERSAARVELPRGLGNELTGGRSPKDSAEGRKQEKKERQLIWMRGLLRPAINLFVTSIRTCTTASGSPTEAEAGWCNAAISPLECAQGGSVSPLRHSHPEIECSNLRKHTFDSDRQK